MNSKKALILVLSLLLLGSGCQHAAHPSLAMQQKFFSDIKSSNPEEEKSLRCAQYYKLAGRFDLAVKELNQALGQDPQNVRLLNALGSCYDKLGDYAKAQEMYDRILSQDHGKIFAMNNLGYSYYLAGDLARAENKFQEVLAKDPGNTLARNNLGLVWCRQGKDNQALTLWQKTEGEYAAREKLTQVLAFLGKAVTKEQINVSATGAKTDQYSIVSSPLANKPEKKARQPEIAQNKISIDSRNSSNQAAAELEPSVLNTSKPANMTKRFSQGDKVKVEEVDMVIQPASYPQPQSTNDTLLNSLNTAPEKLIQARPPEQAGKAMPNPDSRSKARELNINSVLSAEDKEEDRPNYYRNSYRSRPWRRYWRSRTLVDNSPEVQKPLKSLKDYVATGYINGNHRSTGGSEAVVY